MTDQVGILFQQARSNLDAGLPWAENAEMRCFAVQNKVAQYKQDMQIENY